MSDLDPQLSVIDISPTISEKSAVFPGDTSFSRNVALAFAKGDHLQLSSISSSVHIGAHADAPVHYHPDGCGIDQVSLEPYYGLCQVVAVDLPPGERILPKHLKGIPIKAPRVLFRTNSFRDPDCWSDEFNSLSAALIAELSAAGVILVGIDTPSVDPAGDRDLLSHNEIYKCDLRVLEGIILDDVAPGMYTLIALPLKIAGADAAPVRAVLIEPKGVKSP